MQETNTAPPRATPRPGASLFGAPALKRRVGHHRPRVSAYATGTFKMGNGPRIAEVDVMVDGLIITVSVVRGRVVGPAHRGEDAVRFADPETEARVHQAAARAVEDAKSAGWLHV